jgi:DDE superfamily endonuclease
MPTSVPKVLAAWMQPFASAFTPASWRHVLVLVAGTVLAPGRRTVTAALRVMGLDQAAGFAVYHRVLSLGRWSSRAVAHRLLLLLVAALVPAGPVVVGLDDTIERRWGAKIKARGIYRDPVRSSHGHFVKASGLRWLCVMLLAPIPWAGCVWALPFLTVLAPSEQWSRHHRRRHKKTQEADRLGTPSVAPDRALAAGTAGDRGGGQQLCRNRALARCGPAPVHDLTAAARRRSV